MASLLRLLGYHGWGTGESAAVGLALLARGLLPVRPIIGRLAKSGPIWSLELAGLLLRVPPPNYNMAELAERIEKEQEKRPKTK